MKIAKLKIENSRIKKILIIVTLLLVILISFLYIFSYRNIPEKITYGMSFSKFRTDELNLPFEETYLALLDDLGVRHFRFSAHWPLTEPKDDEFNFRELDFQMREAEARGAKVVFSVGRRQPRWPECHVPDWAKELSWEEQKKEIREYVEAVVSRYKDSRSLEYWQIENEPYLKLFAFEHCQDLDEKFLKEEIALVRSLDPDTPILVTDSGNLGLWVKPYILGDAFGTSLYKYFWRPDIGTFESELPAAFYRLKNNTLKLFLANKPTMIIELSGEPWLIAPVVETPIETQLERMDLEKFRETLKFARKTGFNAQFLWGGEWWYWMKKHGHSEIWEYAKTLF